MFFDNVFFHRDCCFGISKFYKIDQISLSYFNRFDFLVFNFFVLWFLYQDNHKLVEARFVWWVFGRSLNGFPHWVVSGILPAMFFLRPVQTFSWFWIQIGVVILVTPKQEVERKTEWFWGANWFGSNFKVEWENGVWTKIRFLASEFLFTCGNFTLIFTVFSIFWIGSFF